MNKNQVVEFIESHKAVAVLRLPSPDLYDQIEEALISGGVKVIEITMTTPDALSIIKKAAGKNRSDCVIGVGSVMDEETANKAVDAGAQFIVSPIIKESIIKAAVQHRVAVMPGAFTPTEIQRAYELGADIVKVFPAGILGMDFFTSVLAPMPHLKLMPTGGVSLTNAADWIKAGACAVGVGSALVDSQSLAQNDFDKIRRQAQAITDNLKSLSL